MNAPSVEASQGAGNTAELGNATTEANNDAESMAKTSDVRLIQELLAAGVPFTRVAELFQGRISDKDLNAIARDLVAHGPAPDAGLGLLMLQRSTSAAQDKEFVSKHMANLTRDAPEDLLDPLFYTLMKDPVVLSSGYVVDRSTVLEQNGQLKFTSCPFTRAPLKRDVYPLIDRRGKLQDFKEQRLDTITQTAETLLAEKSFEQFDEVVAAGERFLDDLGEETYVHRARRLAELRLSSVKMPGRHAPPSEFAKIYARIHRTLQKDELPQFQQEVASLRNEAERALTEGHVEEAGQWCDACEAVQRLCRVKLPVAPIRLELARRAGRDLSEPRRLAYLELRGDPEAEARFLQQEGIGPEDVRDLRPLLLCRAVISDDSMDDAWHVALRSPPLEGRIVKVRVTVENWRDQGWGNQKGKLALALYDENGTEVTRCDLFGTYRAPDYQYGDSPRRTLEEAQEVVARAQPGFTYTVEYTVGGGGGHSIRVDRLQCKIFPVGWTPASSISYRMADPEGDEGLYTGPVDESSAAHGRGELEYDDGDIFVGEFNHGAMVEGALFQGARVMDTMSESTWLSSRHSPGTIGTQMAEKYPLCVVVIGELPQSDDGSSAAPDAISSSDTED